MPYEIVMPQLGLTMTEGAVSAWLKQPGEKVERGEMLFTVETDKVEMEVESMASGFVGAILLEPGRKVPTGTVIAVLTDQPGEAVPAPPAEVPASPRARRLAKELGVDIAQVKPAGGQRIVEDDVRRFHGSRADTPRPASRVPVAQKMAASFSTAPHFYLGVEVNARALVAFNEQVRKQSPQITYTDVFLMALARALREQPAVNMYWRGDGSAVHASVDVGFAVQAADSLLVPVIRNAAALNLADLSRERNALRDKALAGKLTLTDMEGGSATLTNLGPFGVDWFQAILNPPQSVILATGRIATRPMVQDGRVEPCPALTLTLSADHRVLDGAAAAKFLGRIRELVEYPALLLL